jgi:hypothetical protein
LALLVEGFYFGFVQVVFLADCPRQTAEESLEITDARCGVFIYLLLLTKALAVPNAME